MVTSGDHLLGFARDTAVSSRFTYVTHRKAGVHRIISLDPCQEITRVFREFVLQEAIEKTHTTLYLVFYHKHF